MGSEQIIPRDNGEIPRFDHPRQKFRAFDVFAFELFESGGDGERKERETKGETG